jgi:hypothetical protein
MDRDTDRLTIFIGMLVAHGYLSGRNGLDRSANPHASGAAAEAWLTGWAKGVSVREWLLAQEPPGG